MHLILLDDLELDSMSPTMSLIVQVLLPSLRKVNQRTSVSLIQRAALLTQRNSFLERGGKLAAQKW